MGRRHSTLRRDLGIFSLFGALDFSLLLQRATMHREQFVGTPLIVRYLARAGSKASTLLPTDALEATQVELCCSVTACARDIMRWWCCCCSGRS